MGFTDWIVRLFGLRPVPYLRRGYYPGGVRLVRRRVAGIEVDVATRVDW